MHLAHATYTCTRNTLVENTPSPLRASFPISSAIAPAPAPFIGFVWPCCRSCHRHCHWRSVTHTRSCSCGLHHVTKEAASGRWRGHTNGLNSVQLDHQARCTTDHPNNTTCKPSPAVHNLHTQNLNTKLNIQLARLKAQRSADINRPSDRAVAPPLTHSDFPRLASDSHMLWTFPLAFLKAQRSADINRQSDRAFAPPLTHCIPTSPDLLWIPTCFGLSHLLFVDTGRSFLFVTVFSYPYW